MSTSSPNPNWKAGDAQPSPFGDARHICIDPSAENGVYGLMISSVAPRPVALVSSLSQDGVHNLAPFSYFGCVSHDPPMISVSFAMKRGGMKKDTLANIESSGEFVVNMVSDWLVEAASHCAGEYPENINEMEVTGLTPIPSEVVKAPRVKESAVHYECRYSSKQEIYNDSGTHTTTVILARVERIHVVEPLLLGAGTGANGTNNYTVDIEGYKPLGRLGGNTWVQLGDRFDIARPRV